MLEKTVKTDIIVAGGGIAGVISAVAASKQGYRVTIVEKTSCLGGTATSAMLGEMNAAYFRGKPFISNTGKEIVTQLMDLESAVVHAGVSMTSNPSIQVDRVRYNSEILKLVLDSMVQQQNIDVFFNSTIDAVKISGSNSVTVSFGTNYERVRIQGNTLIDASGNADCFHLLGAPTQKQQSEKSQPVTLMFKIGNVDIKSFRTITKDTIQSLLKTGYEKAILPAKILALSEIPGTNEIAVNATRSVNVDHESSEELSAALFETRKQVPRIWQYLKQNAAGFQNSFISTISSSLGIRESRRIKGSHTLTGDEILNASHFDDAVATGTYPVDIHNSETGSVDFFEIKGSGQYFIPYSSMICDGFDNVIASGRCISADDIAFGSIRVMGTVMNTAEAAGIAAALALKNSTPVGKINIKDLQALLRAENMPI